MCICDGATGTWRTATSRMKTSMTSRHAWTTSDEKPLSECGWGNGYYVFLYWVLCGGFVLRCTLSEVPLQMRRSDISLPPLEQHMYARCGYCACLQSRNVSRLALGQRVSQKLAVLSLGLLLCQSIGWNGLMMCLSRERDDLALLGNANSQGSHVAGYADGCWN